MGQKGKGRRDKTNLDENRNYIHIFVNARCLPSCIKVLGHPVINTLQTSIQVNTKISKK